MTHTAAKVKKYLENYIKAITHHVVMSKKANLKNQEKLKTYLSKNDSQSNSKSDNKLRDKSPTDKHCNLRGLRRQAR
jgi:hypothetical protein